MILRNLARCRLCGTIIESRHRHDYVMCNCGSIGVDGGKAYLRRVGSRDHFEELSTFEESDAKSEEEVVQRGPSVSSGPSNNNPN